MARPIFATILVLLTISCSTPPNATMDHHPSESAPDSTIGDPISEHASGFHPLQGDPSVLVFNTGDTLRTGLESVKDMGRFADPLGRSWFLISGRSKSAPENGISLYILSPGDSTSMQALANPWHMPGQLIDTTGKSSYYEAQVFAGEILQDTIGVVWYERAQMPDGQWRHNTTVLDLNGTRPDTLVFFGHNRKSSTIGLAFQGKCRMLDSLDQRLGR